MRNDSVQTPRAGVGQGCLAAGFILGGVVGLGLVLVLFVWPEVHVATAYVGHTCTVLDKRLVESKSDDGDVYRPELQIRYTVDGQEYKVWTYDRFASSTSDRASQQAILDGYRVGGEYPFWYDPAAPAQAVLVRYSAWWVYLVFLGIPLVFLVVGGVMIPRGSGGRAATDGGVEFDTEVTGSARPIAFSGGSPLAPSEYPTVPKWPEESPGTVLPYRLRQTDSLGGACGFVFLIVFTVMWNAITLPIFVGSVVGLFMGRWAEFVCPAVFLIPFALVGLGLIFFLGFGALVYFGIPATAVEVSGQPWRSGSVAELVVIQPGRLRLRSLTATLVCEESVTYRQGTSTRTDTKVVVKRELARIEETTVEAGLPLELRCRCDVPSEAMHSVATGHNSVTWKIEVTGKVAGWPGFQRPFGVTVLPAAGPARPA